MLFTNQSLKSRVRNLNVSGVVWSLCAQVYCKCCSWMTDCIGCDLYPPESSKRMFRGGVWILPPRLFQARRSCSCCGCSSEVGSVAAGWIWNVLSCYLCYRRCWPASRNVRASWRRSSRWPWRRTSGGSWWRRGAATCQSGAPVYMRRWHDSTGPAGWTLER